MVKKTICAGGLVKNKEGKYIIVEQYGVSVTLPKGHAEEGEELEFTARREIFEETGLTDLKLIGFLGQITRFSSHNIEEEKTIHIYHFETESSELKPLDKHINARWVAFNEIVEYLTHEEDKNFILNLKLD